MLFLQSAVNTLQSAVNPLVYGVMNRNFREVFRNLMRFGATNRR